MATYFSPQIDKYFANWILKETWDTRHPLDDGRFHQFIKALDYYEDPNRLDEDRLEEKILLAVTHNHDFDRQAAEEIISKRVAVARKILDFLNETRNFPDPRIEDWEPPLK